MKGQDPIGSLRIAVPCEASWDGMAGDDRVRHCTLCSLNVYNFAEMTRDEVRDLLVRTEGRVCARLYRRADGTVLTRDCPTGLRAIRRRASRIAAALIGFRPARVEHLQLKASEVTHANVALRLDGATVIMGAIAPDDPMMNIGVSTTFSQDFINKMPL